MSLDSRREKRKQARRYRPATVSSIVRSLHDAITSQPAPVVNVAAPSVDVRPDFTFSPVMKLDELANSIAKSMGDLGDSLKAEIARPRKVVCDKDGEPVGTISVESL